MRRALFLAVVVVTIVSFSPAQQTNPPYLREMPSIDRINNEIKGDNDIDTTARRSGAFAQLSEIIYRMTVLQHKRRDDLTPDEAHLITAYSNASVNLWNSIAATVNKMPPGPDRQKLRDYGDNSTFRAELLQKFFSNQFRTLYTQTDQEYAKIRTKFDVETRSPAPAPKQSTIGQSPNMANDPETVALRRCVASGRGFSECFGDALGSSFKVLAPGLAQKQGAAGLRLSGAYTGDASIAFARVSDTLPSGSVAVGCGGLYADAYNYEVSIRAGQVVLRLETKPTAVEFAMQPDGSFKGPGVVTLSGHVVVGYGPPHEVSYRVQDGWTQASTRWDGAINILDNTTYAWVPKIVEGTKTVRDPIFKSASAKCTLNSMKLLPESEKDTKVVVNMTAQQVPPGLRMVGDYEAGNGFGVSFHLDSATVVCGESEQNDKYSVSPTGHGFLIEVQHGSTPFSLNLQDDGSLTPARGGGVITVNGRTMTDVKGGQPVFANLPPVRCQVSGLSPKN